ncbi:LamG-like jellyroll fold domain-containing protein [Vallitalea sp.]|jgi:hypothetical protein|uniref:LamG-like jellyroll fold domain-containing protein n=1 Tax=Vallitalea sp. TaxID=1882829 RepID=UPI0025FBBDC3|nr:LamG-like jellyroll fold domain-containing protein [Vallitalea sp.]MCT4687660.1 hypothetical protein [Vallitalea sp.]
MYFVGKNRSNKGNIILCMLFIISMLFYGFCFNSYATESNEIAYWNFDEGSGDTVNDSWGQNNGVIHGATYVDEGKLNKALKFDGDDYIEIGKSDLSGTWTFAAWVKYDNNLSSNAAIISSDNYAIKAEQWEDTAKVGYTQYGIEDYAFDYSLQSGKWVHLTYVGTNGSVKLYVNGEYKQTYAATVDCPMGLIGKGKEQSGYFIGLLDEIKIYSKALDNDEVAQMASQVAYWKFDEGSGTVAADSWGENNGDVHGATWNNDGKKNGAIEFDGNDYINVGKTDLLTPWTVATWVKYDNDSTNDAVIIGSENNAIKVEQWDDTAKVGFTKYGVGDYTFNYSMNKGEWVHLAFVGTSDCVKLYVNGQYTALQNTSMDCPMGIIGKGKADNGSLYGQLDELKIYSNALSAQTIASLAGVPYVPPTPNLSNASKVLIDKGIQVQAWVTTDETNRYVLSPEDWDAINFTAPTYYEPDLYNSDFHSARPNSLWSIAQAPYGTHLSSGPTNNNHFLTDEQRANIDNLVTMCFGDEEGYSIGLVNKLKAWYDLSKSLYPKALVHNNQWAGQWSEGSLRHYIQTAKPDLLTYDTYYFDETETGGYIFMSSCANNTRVYRKLALEGYDGTGQSPIAFGQYLTGFKTGKMGFQSGNYVISESQINLIPFTTVTMGGKWINYFRWAPDMDFCLIYDRDGNKTEPFYHYAGMAKEITNIGPHLVRLNSSKIYMVPGKHKDGLHDYDNPLPILVGAWNSSVDEYITDIKVENMGDVNFGLAGDVMVGYFELLPGLTDAQKAGVITSDNPKYFMITNGLVNNDGLNSIEKDKGLCSNSKQRITLTMDIGNRNPNSLKKVDRSTGNVVDVTLTNISGTVYTYQFELGGGKGDLFFWE